MTLKEKIQSDLISAIKSRDELRTSTLRLLKAAIMKFEVSGSAKKEATDEEVLKVIEKEMKQRKDSVEAFEKGGKTDMAEREGKEMALLQAYLPEQLSDAALQEIVKTVIAQTGASGKGDFGKVMGASMGQTKGRADGTRVKAVVDSLLE